MKTRLFAILIAAGALVACKRPPGQASVPGPAVNQDAIKALGSTVPEPNYDHSYWLKQHDANTPEWQEAKRLCEQTVLSNYPNCLPVNDIVDADQQKKGEAGNKAAAKSKRWAAEGTSMTIRGRLGFRPSGWSPQVAPPFLHFQTTQPSSALTHGDVLQAYRFRRASLTKSSARRKSEMPPTQFGVFQDVLTQFQTVTATWLGGLYAIGTNLFYMLATIELILVGITGTLRRDFDQLAIDLVRTIAGIMAMFTLFKYGPDFLQNGVILSFTGWASVAGHVPASAMTPGGVMTQGFQLALILLQAIASGWTVFHPSATLNALLLLLSALIILVCFAIIACILLETLIEGYVACVAGTALVATSGTRFTWRFGEGYFGWALGIAVRLFFLYLMVGVGTHLALQWTGENAKYATQFMTNWYFGIEAAVESFLLAVITARIPTKAAQIVDHTVSSTLGDIILGTTLASAIRDGIKAIPKALEVAGKLGGQAFNGVVNLADEGATRGMRMWDQQRREQLKPPAPPTTEDLSKRTTPLGSGPQTQGFNNDWPKTGGLNQTGTSPIGGKAPGTSRTNSNSNGKGTSKL